MGPGFESLKVHQWPIGQVVKTAASHAVNIGSNPVWVTNSKSCYAANNGNPREQQNRKGKTSSTDEFVLIVMWVHLFPSRTQKLSTCTPTILGGRLPGKIGNANTKESGAILALLHFMDANMWTVHLFPVAVSGIFVGDGAPFAAADRCPHCACP